MTTEVQQEEKANPYNKNKSWHTEIEERENADGLFFEKPSNEHDESDEIEAEKQEAIEDKPYKRPNYKKRYDDLKKHYDSKLNEFKAREQELIDEATKNRQTYKAPKSAEELEQDEDLSMLFDKVIEVASEFAGSGPVEGPGTGVSDSIPARLSDGEFVFTAKAVEEIGADNLMAMMKDAEMKADERQGMAVGGMPEDEEETVVVEPTTPDIPTQVVRVERPSVGLQASAQEQQDLVGDEIKKRMMDPSTQARYVRS